MSWRASTLLVAAGLALAGCKPVVDVRNPSPFDEDDPIAGAPDESDRTTDQPSLEVETLAPAPEATSITRSRLDHVLNAGPGMLLSGLDLSPRLDLRNRFLGWEIVRITYQGVDIRPGDVISKVNGFPLGKPHQVQALWDDLRGAESIVVRGKRADNPIELRFEVVDDEQDSSAP